MFLISFKCGLYLLIVGVVCIYNYFVCFFHRRIQIPNINPDRKVVQVACGSHHTIVLLLGKYIIISVCTCTFTFTVESLLKDTTLQGTPRYKGHLATRDTSLQLTPLYKGHLATRDTSLQGTPLYKGHLAITARTLFVPC